MARGPYARPGYQGREKAALVVRGAYATPPGRSSPSAPHWRLPRPPGIWRVAGTSFAGCWGVQ
eukprot:14924902-Alexandrium_andersonii.AAC.1